MKNKILPLLLAVIAIAQIVAGKPAYSDNPSKAIELMFNEGSGAIVHDSSGNGNDGTIYGAAWVKLPTGKWVLSFNGTGNSLNCNYSTSLDISGQTATLSVEAWVDITQNKSALCLGTGTGGNIGGYALYYHQPYREVAGFLEGPPPTGWYACTYEGIAIGLNTWHHFVYTYNGQYAKIYVDGQQEGSSNWTGGIFPSARGFQVYSAFAGMIGKIAIHNYELSFAQIQGIYQTERGAYGYYPPPTSNTIYVYPAITDNKLLPSTVVPNTYITNNINITGSPDEYSSASFVIYAATNISAMTAAASDLIGPGGTISKDSVDIRVVKNWYQSGLSLTDTSHRVLTPELLLKDDALVQIQGIDNYVKYTDNSLHNISGNTQLEGNFPTAAQMPIQDAATLQPVNITSGTNKQFWITLHIPPNAISGNYTGTIVLSGGVGVINLNLTVLPINLLKPNMVYSIYYEGSLNASYANGSISGLHKSNLQLTNELTDMIAHGINNPTYDQSFNDLALFGQYLTIRNNLGIGNKPLYTTHIRPNGYQPVDLVQQIIAFSQTFGVPQVYFYGIDEATGNDLAAQITPWQAIRAAGGRMFASGNTMGAGTYPLVGALLDLFVCYSYGLSLSDRVTEAARWHSVGHQIVSYGNPQLGMELPETYRRNYGLLLWQSDFDGAMDYAYQVGFGNIWNDFDNATFRNFVMAYPTISGVIDTIQWEGFREGVNDVRYLTSLQNTITQAKAAGKNTSAAETWLASLKSSDLTTQDLTSIRSTMINYILALQTTQVPTLDHITVSPSNPSVAVSGNVTFLAQGYDTGNNPITGLTYIWSTTNSTAGSINSSGIFTAGLTAGSYPNVIQATSGNKTGTASVTVTARVLDHITISPANPSVTVSGNVTFLAQGHDIGNNPITGLTYIWSTTNSTAGSINSSGIFTAGLTAGSYPNVIQATSGNKTGTASVTVTARVLDHITISPANPSVTVSGNVTFLAQGHDIGNNPITGLTYIWSTTNSTAGSINSSGIFTAGLTAGSYPNVIQATSGNKTGTASVTVTARVLDHITISPANPSAAVSGNVTFLAQGHDIGNNPITGLTYIWSTTNSTAGSINSSGIFTAGTTAGGFPNVIRAVSGGKIGTASVTITSQQYSAYDINQDGNTNVLEMIRIGQHMGQIGTPGWISEDVNRDGVISVLDSIIIGQHWTG